MLHTESFKSFLQKEDIYFEEVPLNDGSHGFKLLQTLENGPRLILGVTFNSKDTIVDINIYNIAKITNPLKLEMLLSLVNELNDKYRFAKFVVANNEVTVSYAMNLYGNYDYSSAIFDKLLMLYNVVKDEFPKFMKLQWS